MTYCIDLHSIAPYKHQAKGDLQKIYIDWQKKDEKGITSCTRATSLLGGLKRGVGGKRTCG